MKTDRQTKYNEYGKRVNERNRHNQGKTVVLKEKINIQEMASAPHPMEVSVTVSAAAERSSSISSDAATKLSSSTATDTCI